MRMRHMLLAVGLLALGCDAPAEPIAPAPAEAPAQFRCATDDGAFIVGLEEITVCGNVEVIGGEGLDLFSNELIHLSGSYYLLGDAVVADGGVFEVSGRGNTLEGEMRSDASRIVAEPATAEAAAVANNNNNNALVATKNGSPVAAISDGKLRLSGKTNLVVPAGDYYFENGIQVSGQATITVQGPVRFFVNGAVRISGTTKTSGDDGDILEVISISSDRVTLAGTSEARLHISAPLAKVRVAGTVEFFGSILGRVVSLTGTATIGAAGDATSYGSSCEPPADDDGGDGGEDGDDGDEPPPWDDGRNPWDPEPDPEMPTDPL